MLDAPSAMKSRLTSGRARPGVRTVSPTPTPCTSTITAMAKADRMMFGVRYARCGRCGVGTPRGIAPSSVTFVESMCATRLMTVGMVMASSAPNWRTRVRANPTRHTIATKPSSTVVYFAEPICVTTCHARVIGRPEPPLTPVKSDIWEKTTFIATPERNPSITGWLTKRT